MLIAAIGLIVLGLATPTYPLVARATVIYEITELGEERREIGRHKRRFWPLRAQGVVAISTGFYEAWCADHADAAWYLGPLGFKAAPRKVSARTQRQVYQIDRTTASTLTITLKAPRGLRFAGLPLPPTSTISTHETGTTC